MFSSLRRFDIVPVLLRQRRLTLEDNHFTTWSIMRRHNLLLSGWPFKLETVKLRQLTDWLLLILHRVIGLTDWVGGEPNSPVCLLARLCRYETLLFLQWRRRGGRSGGKVTGERLEKYWRERERRGRSVEEVWQQVWIVLQDIHIELIRRRHRHIDWDRQSAHPLTPPTPALTVRRYSDGNWAVRGCRLHPSIVVMAGLLPVCISGQAR